MMKWYNEKLKKKNFYLKLIIKYFTFKEYFIILKILKL